MKVLGSILIAFVLLNGCAVTPPQTASDRVFSSLKGEKVVTSVYFAHETISYMSEGFMHEKLREANFGAVLDVKASSTDEFTKKLISVGLKATSIYDVLDDKSAKQFVLDERRGLLGKEKIISKWSQSDVNDWHGYHKDINNIPLDEMYAHDLLQSENRYLVELIFSPQLRAAKTMGTESGVITSGGYIRVINLQTKSIHYAGAIFSNMSVPLTKASLKQSVETSNLLIIRQFVDQTIERILSIQVGDI